jgi:hypothetical protein
MTRSRKLRLSLLGAGISMALVAAYLPAAAQSSNAASPAFGKLFNAASAALSSGQFAAATRDVNQAAALPGNNAYEQFAIVQMRAAIAAKSGDTAGALSAYIDEVNSGRLEAGTALQVTEAIVGFEYTLKNYAEAATWADRYYHQGGSDSRLKSVQIGAHYLNGDYAGAQRLQQAVINAELRAGQTPSENDFDMLYSCAAGLKDAAGADAIMRQAVIYYPKPNYWEKLVQNVTNADGFDHDRFDYDAGLLNDATKSLTTADDYMSLIQVALQGGHSGMAQKLFNEGNTAGVLGTGTTAAVARQQRLQKLITTTMANDRANEKANLADAATNGSMAATVGYNLVDLGQLDQGIALMQKGLEMGVNVPSVVRLRLGEAQALSGNTAAAIKTFGTVTGTNGAAGLAQLWIIHLTQKA